MGQISFDAVLALNGKTATGIEVPGDVVAALQQHEAAGIAFASLSNSGKKRYVLSITSAKTAQTRQRRLDKTLAELDAAKR
jgi:uncharacterized protein YdeI (YjbR/CyaY-like superfamily)